MQLDIEIIEDKDGNQKFTVSNTDAETIDFLNLMINKPIVIGLINKETVDNTTNVNKETWTLQFTKKDGGFILNASK